MKGQFGLLQQVCSTGSGIVASCFSRRSCTAKSSIRECPEEYEDNLRLGYSLYSLDAELQRFEAYILEARATESLPQTPTDPLKVMSTLLLPCLTILLELVLTFPVTTCRCDRSLSSLGSINPLPTREVGHIVPPPPHCTLPQISQERLELRTCEFLTI